MEKPTSGLPPTPITWVLYHACLASWRSKAQPRKCTRSGLWGVAWVPSMYGVLVTWLTLSLMLRTHSRGSKDRVW